MSDEIVAALEANSELAKLANSAYNPISVMADDTTVQILLPFMRVDPNTLFLGTTPNPNDAAYCFYDQSISERVRQAIVAILLKKGLGLWRVWSTYDVEWTLGGSLEAFSSTQIKHDWKPVKWRHCNIHLLVAPDDKRDPTRILLSDSGRKLVKLRQSDTPSRQATDP